MKSFFVIGGAEIFKETFKISDRLYITLIDSEFEGDTYFPESYRKPLDNCFKSKGV